MKFTEKDIEYYTWRSEIYMSLMNWSLIDSDSPNREECIKEIQELVSICDNELIDKLLATENWRSRLVAACLIGFQNESSYIDIIGENLVSGCGGIAGYCYALAKFADEKSVYYLTQFLDKHLLFDGFPNERRQFWAFRALQWVDKVNNTNISQNYLGENGLWTKFVDFEHWRYKFKLSDSGQWRYAENDYLEPLMNFYRDNFEVK